MFDKGKWILQLERKSYTIYDYTKKEKIATILKSIDENSNS